MALGISLDGYIARRDGTVDFLVMDPDYDWSRFMKRIDKGAQVLNVADAASLESTVKALA